VLQIIEGSNDSGFVNPGSDAIPAAFA